MALEVKNLAREFKFKKDGTLVTLPDPNPDFSVNEVLQFYSGQYPELTTATMAAGQLGIAPVTVWQGEEFIKKFAESVAALPASNEPEANEEEYDNEN